MHLGIIRYLLIVPDSLFINTPSSELGLCFNNHGKYFTCRSSSLCSIVFFFTILLTLLYIYYYTFNDTYDTVGSDSSCENYIFIKLPQRFIIKILLADLFIINSVNNKEKSKGRLLKLCTCRE